MIHLQYNFIDSNGLLTNLKLTCESSPDIWHICDCGFVLASISRNHGGWKQLSGDSIPASLIRGAGAYIERYFQESIPLKIKERWPRVISSINKDAQHIIITCREHVNIKTFRPIFCRFVPELLKTVLNVNMLVYSFDGSQHFAFQIGQKTLKNNNIITEHIY